MSLARNRFDYANPILTFVLAVITAIQAVLLKRTLDVVKEQAVSTKTAADAARDNVQAARDNAAAAKDGATAAKEGAEAAKANAEAARDNAKAVRETIEVMINKERARVTVEVKPLNLEFSKARLEAGLRVEYEVISYGANPAFVMDATATINITDSIDPPPSNLWDYPDDVPKILYPSKDAYKQRVYYLGTFTQEGINSINEKKLFVHFHGAIKYRDFSERKRETKFRYFWEVGNLFSFWIKCGDESENSET